MADVIVTRNKAEYVAALDKLKKDDLRAAQKAQREQVLAERTAAVELKKRRLPEPKLISREEYLSKKRRKKHPAQAQQRPAIIPFPRKAKVVARQKRKKTKKPKKRSVWTVSGGAFESNRRRH